MMSDTAQGWALDTLLEGMADTPAGKAVAITGLTMDSRAVQTGDLFLACQGQSGHGLDYVQQAVAAGAAAVAYDAPADVSAVTEVPMVPVVELGVKAGRIADRFYNSPSQHLSVIAVTGTNGKTSVSHYIAQVLQALYGKCGLLGTLGYGLYGDLDPGMHTTPDVVTVHRMMSTFVDMSCDYAVMEVSSHALDQGRVDAMRFAVAVFTNLSRDHLDYHGDMLSYAATKRRLFNWAGLQSAVINADDPTGREWLQSLPVTVTPVAFSMSGPVPGVATVSATNVQYSLSGIRMDLSTPSGEAVLTTGLLGHFNAENSLAALAVLLQLGVKLEVAIGLLEALEPVAGRMQRLSDKTQTLIVVDYAHTPDALEQALTALRPHISGRILCVFGCGGDRDQGKRPLMGEVAARCADTVIVTDDNPRSEDPATITDQIISGIPDAGVADVIHDRKKAIHAALQAARPDDAILIAGKGHESGQIIDGKILPFDDSRVVNDWLEKQA